MEGQAVLSPAADDSRRPPDTVPASASQPTVRPDTRSPAPAPKRYVPAAPSFCSQPLWIVVLLSLVLWQSWMTLRLFGADAPWDRMLDDEPIISGRHPLHLYHGYLGARTFLETGRVSCLDPSFQALYPKTPVFDSGSRPNELFLTLAGGQFSPSACKLGLAICCTLVPLFFAAAARALGQGPGPACVAATLGVLVWWSDPAAGLLVAGDLDLLLAGLAALLHVGLLSAFDRSPGVGAWCGLVLADSLGWFCLPLFFATMLPVNLVFYLGSGPRHRNIFWHLALFAALAAAIALNCFWLFDWIEFWWLRSALPTTMSLLIHRTFQTIWSSGLWGGPSDRVLALCLLGGAVFGLAIWNQSRQRSTARLLGLGLLLYLTLAVAGIAWEPAARMETARLLTPALAFAVLPAVQALSFLVGIAGKVTRLSASPALGRIVPIAACPVALVLLTALRAESALALPIGLTPEQHAQVALLSAHTSADARILWEEEPGSGWTALLPLLSERSFLGGLDARARFDYGHAVLAERKLAGRPLADWSDQDLEEFCRRYNVGWIVCRSPEALSRFGNWKAASATAAAAGKTLFTVQRPHSFILAGQARWLEADRGRITLADVVPDNGAVVLSLHYFSGLKASPGSVLLERDPDISDPVPFIRLRVPGPVTRVTLQWDNR